MQSVFRNFAWYTPMILHRDLLPNPTLSLLTFLKIEIFSEVKRFFALRYLNNFRPNAIEAINLVSRITIHTKTMLDFEKQFQDELGNIIHFGIFRKFVEKWYYSKFPNLWTALSIIVAIGAAGSKPVPLVRRFQNRILGNCRFYFRVFGRLKCIKMCPKWALNFISALQTLENG